MRILHIGPVKSKSEASGPTQSICGLAEAQARLGVDVGIFSTWPSGIIKGSCPGVKILSGVHKRECNPWHTSGKWIDQIKEEFGRPDIVNFHGVYNPFQCALSRLFKKEGWNYTLVPHGCMTYLAQNSKKLKKRIANLLWFNHHVKNAIAVRALCAREGEEILSQFRVKKLFVVPNGIEGYFFDYPEKISLIDRTKSKSPNILNLSFVGRIAVYHKGLDFLLEALGLLNSEDCGFQCRLSLVGPFSTSKDESDIRSMIERFGLKKQVEIVGPKYGEDKIRYFLEGDVFVHTSRHEGMPMSVLEAMAMKRPCLVTPGTNMADMVSQGGGWVCEPNPNSIAKAIKDIFANKSFLTQRGLNAQKLIKESFTWDRVAEKMCEEDKKLLSGF